MKKLCAFILKTIGWKIEGITNYPDKCILCVAPHTSNWDLILGQLVYTSMGKKASFLMKKSWFFFPFNVIFNAIGGIPVDRDKKNSLTQHLAEEFSKRNKFQLAITPEGTRKKKDDWKRGFYYIAFEAKVPIIIIVLDYAKKSVNFKEVFYPTGDVENDIREIKSYYKGAKGKIPENFTI